MRKDAGRRLSGNVIRMALYVFTGVFLCSVILSCERGSASGASFYGEAPEPEKEEVNITIPGMKKEVKLLWISDLHICSGPDDPDVTDEHRQEAEERYEMMVSGTQLPACETWEALAPEIDSFGADYVIFGADMIDYASEKNLASLKAGLDLVHTPWMYIRADHDYGRWFSDMGIRRMRKLHRSIAPQNRLWCRRFDDFTLVGLDNTTTDISDEALDEFTRITEEGAPVILCTHVPLDTGSADCADLAVMSSGLWDDRVLCWGEGDYYDTSGGGNMSKIIDMIKAPDSPVCAVLAGHLHASWDGDLTPACREHVFSAAFENHIGVITVSG